MRSFSSRLLSTTAAATRVAKAKPVPTITLQSASDLNPLVQRILASAAAGPSASPSCGPVLIKGDLDYSQKLQQASSAKPSTARQPSLFENAQSDSGWEAILCEMEKSPGIGDTLVPVEMGHNYMDASRLEVPLAYFASYLRKIGDMESFETEAAPLIYLAQHQLFEQLGDKFTIQQPHLLRALREESRIEAVDIYSVVAWMGPCGTFSPLHADPHDNCFTQFRGYKRFRIVDPSVSGIPRSQNALQQNTVAEGVTVSSLNVPFYECVLSPSDCLYLPKHFWHEVRALASPDEDDVNFTTSASATHWWRVRVKDSTNHRASMC